MPIDGPLSKKTRNLYPLGIRTLFWIEHDELGWTEGLRHWINRIRWPSLNQGPRLIGRGRRRLCPKGLCQDEEPECPHQGWKHQVREGDIRRYRDVKETLSGCDVVFHLAAQAIVGESIRRPRATLETNIMGTVNVLEAARSSGAVEAIVVASTDKVYGEPKSLPVTEGHPLAWKNPYELSKVSADLCAQMFANIYGLPIAITRCSNIRARRRQFLQSHPELRDRRAARKASRDQEQR